MPLVITQVKTWVCSQCPFKWQFKGAAVNTKPTDLTPEQYQAQFPFAEQQGIQPGQCPGCYGKGVSSELYLSLDTADMSVITVADDTELEAITVPQLDAEGKTIPVQVGEHYAQQFDQTTGQTSVITVPEYSPQMRSLTDQELTDLKAQRDADASTAEAISA